VKTFLKYFKAIQNTSDSKLSPEASNILLLIGNCIFQGRSYLKDNIPLIIKHNRSDFEEVKENIQMSSSQFKKRDLNTVIDGFLTFIDKSIEQYKILENYKKAKQPTLPTPTEDEFRFWELFLDLGYESNSGIQMIKFATKADKKEEMDPTARITKIYHFLISNEDRVKSWLLPNLKESHTKPIQIVKFPIKFISTQGFESFKVLL
jgi:hypothetical protein